MSGRRSKTVDQAVRPADVQDVDSGGEDKGEEEKEEGPRGEEPLEVSVNDKKGRGEEDKEGEEESPGKRVPEAGVATRMRNIGDPRLPTQKEVDEHNVTHVPYRNWCPHCIRGRGRDLDHRRSVDAERRMLEFSFDYCFMGDSGDERITILVGRERSTGMSMATVVPAKGGTGQFAALKVLEFIRLCGAEEADIIVKTDQEPAIDILIKDVVKARGAVGTVVEKSPVGSSGSNGVVERAVQSVEGVIRTLKSACEARWNITLKPRARTIVFLTEYAAYLRGERRQDRMGTISGEKGGGDGRGVR